MRGEIDRPWLRRTAREQGFHEVYLERAYRLATLLAEIADDPWLADRVTLKGGTRIHFFQTGLRRLSVDLDLDYTGAIDQETMRMERPLLERRISELGASLGYRLDIERTSYVTCKARLVYTNSFGGPDAIRLDINYLMRVPLFPTASARLPDLFSLDALIPCLSIEESYGGKLAALLGRTKARDLYDAFLLFTEMEGIDTGRLRQATAFYRFVHKRTPDGPEVLERSPTADDLRHELYPVLRAGERPDLHSLRDPVLAPLAALIAEDEATRRFASRLGDGSYEPQHLFGREVTAAVRSHPAGLWRAKVNASGNNDAANSLLS